MAKKKAKKATKKAAPGAGATCGPVRVPRARVGAACQAAVAEGAVQVAAVAVDEAASEFDVTWVKAAA